jgi:hypothetical protein
MFMGLMIANLRSNCPVFAGRVAGAADFNRGLRDFNAAMPRPAAYVVPIGQDSSGNQNMVGLYQILQTTMAVIVEFDATNDRRGQDPAMGYDDVQTALYACLLNWKPVPCAGPRGMYTVGGHYLDLDRARLFYQWEFALDVTLSDQDGASLDIRDPDWAPLRDIVVSLPQPVVRTLTKRTDWYDFAEWDEGDTTWDDNRTLWDAVLVPWDDDTTRWC